VDRLLQVKSPIFRSPAMSGDLNNGIALRRASSPPADRGFLLGMTNDVHSSHTGWPPRELAEQWFTN